MGQGCISENQRHIRIFTLVWFAQMVSAIGTGLTNFALGVWVYQQTGSAINLTIIYLCGSLPSILTLPLAGALVDRWSRRRVMLLSNLGACLSTLPAALLLLTGWLETWQVGVIVLSRAVFLTFLNPAFTAAVATLIPKQHYGRAVGMMQASQSVAQIAPPLLAGFLIVGIGINWIILIDLVTYVFALIVLQQTRFAEIVKDDASGAVKNSLLGQVSYGWTYIKERPGLLALQLYFTAVNFAMSITQVLLTPMILSFTSSQMLGVVLSISGGGFLIGSVIMSVWGGPKDRVQGTLSFGVLIGLGLILAGLRPSVPLIAGAMFSAFLFVPFVNGCGEAIWLAKTEPQLQGRVFAIRRMIQFSSVPVAHLIAGVMAEKIFEPMAAPGGLLNGIVRPVIGEGPGRGIGLIYVIAGILTLLAPAVAYLYPRLRLIEYELSDAITSRPPSEA